jgi:hypothetical protein
LAAVSSARLLIDEVNVIASKSEQAAIFESRSRAVQGYEIAFRPMHSCETISKRRQSALPTFSPTSTIESSTPMSHLNPTLADKLTRFALALIDQQQAQVIVPPIKPEPGFWFGGGNLVESDDGTLCLVGRYRNAGDSRTGLAAGERGCELAVFLSDDRGRSFQKVLRLDKADLSRDDQRVLSIEGAAIVRSDDGYELFVSTEKDGVGYPPGFEDHLKLGTGVWAIDRRRASSIDGLTDAPQETVVSSRDPRFVHVKDPFVYRTRDDDFMLLFCSHPYCWSSSNTGYAVRQRGSEAFAEPVFNFFPRGFTWDVAMTRGTCALDIPMVGGFADTHVTLLFYDGGECVRNHDEHKTAVKRPRGYSCEELGGAGYVVDGDFARIERLSQNRPLFVSPHATGCSRYVDVLVTSDGFYATWQQAQPDGSQPLVMNFLPHAAAQALLN